MSGPVDVLAALQQIADGDGDVELLAMRVRAAVAELIEASNVFWRATDYGREECSAGIARRFEAAIAKATGEQP